EVKENDIGPLTQSLMTVGYMLPAAVGAVGAAVFPGVTGGWDVVWASTLVTTPVLERIVDQLGREVREKVSLRWSKTHGERIARQLERQLFAPLVDELEGRIRRLQACEEALEVGAATLAGLTRGEE